jgi:hypothetical protein
MLHLLGYSSTVPTEVESPNPTEKRKGAKSGAMGHGM